MDETALATWGVRASLEAQLGVDHPTLVGLQTRRAALESIVSEIRSGHGFWDPWTPTPAQDAALTDAADYLAGVAATYRTEGVTASMHALRDQVLAHAPSDPALVAVRSEALELVDRNIQRLAGTLDDGYPGHPDYAEVGRVRAAIDLLETIQAAATPRTDGLAW